MTTATKQLQAWRGKFGKAYTVRNVIDWRLRVPAFEKMLSGLQLNRVLEVGCNRGHNLQSLLAILPDDTEILGVEPNPYALALARSASNKFSVLPGDIFDLPFKDNYFDLVFTAGVLIHISPERLADAMLEIARVSRRYALAVEYYAAQETAIEYRGHANLLWKQDFLKKYRTVVPQLILVRSGRWEDDVHGFAESHWWLMEKPQPGSRAAQSAGSDLLRN